MTFTLERPLTVPDLIILLIISAFFNVGLFGWMLDGVFYRIVKEVIEELKKNGKWRQ